MKRNAWLLAAALLLAAAAWLMARGDSKAKPAPAAKVEFPRYPNAAENDRNQRRRTLPPAPSPSATSDFRPRRDPLLTALPSSKGKSTMVFEASALKDLPVGQLWLDCMLTRQNLAELDRFKKQYGVNPLEDVDRIAVSSEKVVVLDGRFDEARFDLPGRRHRAYGVKGMIYEDEEGGGHALAVWNKSMLIVGRDKAGVEAALDRLEDRAPPSAPPIPEWAAYGDVYGLISADDLSSMLPPSQRETADRLRSAVEQIEIHVDASEDVAIVADVTGPRGEDVDDLGKSLGAALSMARLKAQADGDEKLAELMDLARVSPRDGRFSVDLALPMAVIKQQLGPCPRDREDRDAGAAP